MTISSPARSPCTKLDFAADEVLPGRYEPAGLASHKTAHEALVLRALQLHDCLARLDAVQLLRQLQIVERLLTEHWREKGATLNVWPQHLMATAAAPPGTTVLASKRPAPV
jgi:hypothetical protein